MKRQGSGFTDKLFWRPFPGGVWHCLKHCSGVGGYISLCHQYESKRSGGQKCARPPAGMRCGRCDGREMQRRGHDESMTESPDWRDYENWSHS